MRPNKGFVGLGVLIAIVLGLIVVGGGAYYVMHQSAVPQAQQNAPDISETQQSGNQNTTTAQPANTSQITLTATLPVVALQTESGLGEPDTYTYPKTVSFTGSSAYVQQLGAFGAVGNLWLGLQGWAGSAAQGVDGNTSITLYPKGAGKTSATSISYAMYPACLSCILSGAAPFFPQAAQALQQQYSDTPTKLKNLSITKLSSSVVTYTYVNDSGATVYGAAEYTPQGDSGFQQVEFALPSAQAGLASYLTQTEGHALVNGVGLNIPVKTTVVSSVGTQTIQNPTYQISLQVPQDWTVGTEYKEYGDIGVLPISSPAIKGAYSADCDAAAGCPKYSLGISATAKWPHDPAIYTAGTETLVDGTAQTFQATLALPNGSSQRVKNELATKVKNMTIGGADAVFINSHTAPDVATEPFNEDIIWIRKGNMNWYIYPSDYSSNTSVYDTIFASIKLGQ